MSGDRADADQRAEITRIGGAVIGRYRPSSVKLSLATGAEAMTVGFTEGLSFDKHRPNWRGDGLRPLRWCSWYPAVDAQPMQASSEGTWFRSGPVVRDAPIRPSAKAHPVVLVSHGTGGVAAGLEWLASRLAMAGYIVLAVNHHGNNGLEPYCAEGFLCLWERAADLSALLDDCDWKSRLKVPDEAQIAVAGFSAGAYTAMLVMGARVAYSQFEAANPEKSPIRGPREFPNLADEIPSLLDRSRVFREAWARRTADYRDQRVKAALLLAPGRSVRGFSTKSLRRIEHPIKIVAGKDDLVAPVKDCASWLHNQVPTSELRVLDTGVGHYTFLPEPTALGLTEAPDIFQDGAGIDRREIHAFVSSMALDFFRGSFTHSLSSGATSPHAIDDVTE